MEDEEMNFVYKAALWLNGWADVYVISDLMNIYAPYIAYFLQNILN